MAILRPMGQPSLPSPIRLVVGLLAKETDWMDRARKALLEKFGEEDASLGPFPFIWTHYYREELGDSPLRLLLAYEKPIPRESVVDIKLWTNQLELAYANGGLRPVNVDPGYMTLGQFFLATTKDQRQRVYVRDGIYVEPTLYYEKGSWQAFPWTYRDWKSDEYRPFFNVARQRFAYQRSAGKPWRCRSVSSPD